MSKVKVSKVVAEFIDDYARNMSHVEDWKDKLLIDHSITYSRGFDGYNEKVKVLKDITPMKMAEILHNGYEVAKYNKDNLPKYLKVKHHETNNAYNIIIYKDMALVEYKILGGKSESTEYEFDVVLKLLNEGTWIVI